MLISYKSILKEAWRISIANPFLLLFGVFASFFSLENVYEIILSQINQARQSGEFFFKISSLYQDQIAFFDRHVYNLNLLRFNFTSYLIFILAGAAIMLFIWLAFTSQIYIIRSSALFYHGKNIAKNQTFFHSQEKFWPVFFLNIIVKLVIFAGFIILSLPLLYFILTKNFASLFYANIVFFLLFTIFAVVMSFIAAYATNYIVLKNYNIFESLSAAWKLFAQNIFISLEMAFILFLLKIVSLIAIFSCFLIFFGPLSLLLFYSFISTDLLGVVLSITLIILSFIIVSLLINAFFTVFYLSSWTITFIKLTEETLIGKILNLVYNIPSLFKDLAGRYGLGINKRTLKKEAIKLSKATEKQAKIISKELGEKYKEYKPVAIKQGKILAKKIQTEYRKIEPDIKKQANKIVKKIAAQVKAKPAASKKPKKTTKSK